MIFLASLLAATDPPPLNLQPFADEPVAGRALEIHLDCLASHGFERRNDAGNSSVIARQVVAACDSEAAALRGALREVYTRKPQLLSAGASPEQAAALYVNNMNGRVEGLILEGRQHR